LALASTRTSSKGGEEKKQKALKSGRKGHEIKEEGVLSPSRGRAKKKKHAEKKKR